MLNQAVVEALYSATYLENYLDCVEDLPLELQRHLTHIRELDATCQNYIREIDQQQEVLSKTGLDAVTKQTALEKLEQALLAARRIGDDKIQIVQTVQDLIENKSRQLDTDFRNSDFGKEQENNESSKNSNPNVHVKSSSNVNSNEKSTKRARRTRTETLMESAQSMDMIAISENRLSNPSSSNGSQKRNAANANVGKKKKRKSKTAHQNQQREDTPPPVDDENTIDPDEPTYCLCDQISYGEMILCDNDLCPIEWFHFSCVSLNTKPKGKWFCPKCRGDRPNIMKPKAQFLKELALYNKEKEEKS
ncbi:inhibitor of growth protein 1-like [Phymastichus coffea]|uniref:inhibitor of growth protein 1-like n=1 Tax=Phymastichus coffea TaxID=108790 RepID=UPI00273A90CB|nr:inhibitor of growth protein 1-like [Phymastichus coffea]